MATNELKQLYARILQGKGSLGDLRTTQEEYLKLFEVRDSGNPRNRRLASELIMLRSARFVISRVKPYTNKGIPMEDLILHGMTGLHRAVELYDPGKGYNFSTYATLWILKPVRLALQEASFLHLPAYRHEHLFKIRREIGKSSHISMSQPQLVAHLAQKLSLPVQEVTQLLYVNSMTQIGMEDLMEVVGSYDPGDSLPTFSENELLVLDLAHGLTENPGQCWQVSRIAKYLNQDEEIIVEILTTAKSRILGEI